MPTECRRAVLSPACWRLLFAIVIAVSAGCTDCDGDNNVTNNGVDGGADASPGDASEDDSGAPSLAALNEPGGGWWLHVAARSETEAYVAGGTPTEGRLLGYDGAEWTDEALPDGTPLLNWVHLFDDGTAVVVGNGGTVLWNDGTGWAAQDSPTVEDLWGVWGASPDDIWAVGGRGREAGQATVLRRQDGLWAAVEIPTLERPGVNAFFKVWGSGPEDVYIIGQKGGGLHYTGGALEEFGTGTSEDLIALSGTGPNNVVLVGGRGNGVIARWDGAQWHTASAAPAPGINGIWMKDATHAWIAGVRGTLREATFADDGTFDMPSSPPESTLDLHAVTHIPGLGLVAVGGNFTQPQGPYDGVAVLKEEF